MRILFAGGGTGGHIIPGRNLAECFAETWEDCDLRFLVSGRKVEDDFFKNRNWSVKPLFPGQISRPSIFNPIPWIKAVKTAAQEIKDFKPDLIILLGGYASLPILLTNRKKGIPIYSLELNALPGKTARFSAYFVNRIFCQFESAAKRIGVRGVATGSPLPPRFGRGNIVSKAAAREKFGLYSDQITLLVAGGSLGARAVNLAVLDNLKLLEKIRSVQILHVTGAREYEMTKARYLKSGIKAVVLPFVDPMEHAYCAADLIFCRGGGMTMAEVAAIKLPSVVVPYPYHKDQHQLHNAGMICEGGGGVILEEKDISADSFRSCVVELLLDPDRLSLMSKKLESAGDTKGAVRIVEFIKKDLKKVRN